MSRRIFTDALARQNLRRPPVWFMRQAGRYHSHYQKLKEKHSFMDLCKKPDLAAEVTYGPLDDFGFDAAILFSDLLFPLEAMGMGLEYSPGPKLGWHLESPKDVARLKSGGHLASQMSFQAEALTRIRKRIGDGKGLIGFVGAPLTLYYYAAEGSHQGALKSAHAGLTDGRFEGFCLRLEDLLVENMSLQASAGPDAIAIFDTCGGELSPEAYAEHAVPALARVLDRFTARHPGTPVIYYSKGTGPAHWASLIGLPITCLGVDWKHDLVEVIQNWGDRYAIQGNIDPEWLRDLPALELERRVRGFFERMRGLPLEARAGWICGLGHGVLQQTPEDNVRLVLRLQRELFS